MSADEPEVVEESYVWPFLVGGMFLCSFAGFVYVIHRLLEQQAVTLQAQAQAQLNGPSMPFFAPMLAAPAAQPAPVVQAPTYETARTAKESKMGTFTLGTKNVSRVMTAASARHWTARISCINPPGGYALVSNQATNLAFQSESITIPAGQSAEIHVAPGEALFAIGTVPGVQISVFASEDVA